jgi:excisionase family DNA binding protein
VAELDAELRSLGVRGRLTPLDPLPKPVKRSTRRQDAPDLPRRPVEKRTVGRVFAGRYRPSTFLTLTLDSYGRVDSDGAAVDPDRYDYRRAARDAIHFPALLDRFWQNTRRCVGWDVQYFGTVEPQKRGAPHFHAAIRGAIPRAELRAITAATYHQVWWPAHDQLVYTNDRLPVWDTRTKAFTDPDTGVPLPTWDQACDDLTEPAHVVRFGTQVHVKGIFGGTEEAGRHVGYLTKYLTKSVGHATGLDEHATDAQRDHARRLHAELQVTPCSPKCSGWLLYGIQPQGARHSMTPGRCKGKAHKPEHLGIASRRVLVSRKWSNKTLDDHRAERGEFVRQLLEQAGIQPTHGPKDGPTCGNVPPPQTPTCRPARCCSSMPSPSDNGGKPSTPPHNSPQADHHQVTTVRQPAIKPPERRETMQNYLTVLEAAAYLNTSERFVRRLIAERRIAFHRVGRYVRFARSDLDAWLLAGRVEPITVAAVRRHLGQVA